MKVRENVLSFVRNLAAAVHRPFFTGRFCSFPVIIRALQPASLPQ